MLWRGVGNEVGRRGSGVDCVMKKMKKPQETKEHFINAHTYKNCKPGCGIFEQTIKRERGGFSFCLFLKNRLC